MKAARFVLCVGCLCVLLWQLLPTASAQRARPNILLIVSDDQRYDSIDYMPHTRARIFNQGINFTNAYVTTPLCCPSRASILTGMYAHQHNVRQNYMPLLQTTFMQHLKDSGYYTGLVGKYLKYWDASPRPEYDYWVSYPGDISPYTDPDLNVNGKRGVVPGYITHLFRDYALDFLERASAQSQPFALVFTPNAPHSPAIPAPEAERLYANLAPHRPPSYNEADVSGKPVRFQSLPPLSDARQREIDQFRRQQLQTLYSLDQALEDMLQRLEQHGQLDNTLVVYVSDNGFSYGEHRAYSKGVPYEESVKVPFAIRYPPLVGRPREESRLVANIDIAPTIYELAGISTPPTVDGRSLLPLMRGTNTWRDSLLMESWEGGVWSSLHTDRYVYIDTRWDRPELYDLQRDPYQLTNLVDDPIHASVAADLKRRLALLAEPIPAGDDSDYAVTFDGWTGSETPSASGGGYRVATSAGQTATYTTPISSTSVGLVTLRGPAQGMAEITIDNVVRGTIDLYSPTKQYRAVQMYSGLASKPHTINVRVLGKKQAASRDTKVVVDAFQFGSTVVDDVYPTVGFSNWTAQTLTAGEWLGGSARRSSMPGASVTYRFSGTHVTWHTLHGPKLGMAEVFVDGKSRGIVDLYATEQQNASHTFSGISSGQHTLRIVVTGARNAQSAGTVIWLDTIAAPFAVWLSVIAVP